MSTFLSTYTNKVDRKGRVSVPAAYRAALSQEAFQGIIAYPPPSGPALVAFGRSLLDRMNDQRVNRSLEGGAFEELLLGNGKPSVIDTIMALSHELPFDGEGRIILPAQIIERAGITDRAVFVGRGPRIEIWSPEARERQLAAELAGLQGGGNQGPGV